MSNKHLTHNLIFGKFMYRILESAELIAQDDWKRYFNPAGIKFPVEFTTKLAHAQLDSVKEYLSKNGSQDVNDWLNNRLNESKQCQALRQYYLNIFIKQLKDIQYKKWKAQDRYLSFRSLKNGL